MKFKCKAAVALAVPAALFADVPASAQAGSDVKCLLASNLFAKAAKEPKTRTAAEASKLYYLGRIHVRLNAAQLKAEMLAQQKTITPKNAGATMNTCARQMESGIKMVQAVTQQIAPKRK